MNELYPLQPAPLQQELPAESSPVPTTIGEWKKQHKIEKHQGPGILGRLVQTVAAVAVPIIALISLPFWAAYKGISYLKEKWTLTYKPDSVLTSIRDMKQTEETGKFDTMKQALTDVSKRVGAASTNADSKEKVKDIVLQLTKDLETKLDKKGLKKIKREKIVRHILRELSRQNALTPELMKKLQNPSVQKYIEETDEADPYFIWGLQDRLGMKGNQVFLNIDFTKILQKTEKETTLDSKTEIAKFQRSLTRLLLILENSDPNDAAECNQCFIKELRVALNSPVYQALKEDITDPSTSLLQRFASDMWNKAPSIDAYEKVGDALCKNHATPSSESTPSLADSLDGSHEKIAKEHWTDHGLPNKIAYGITHTSQALGSMASEGGKMKLIPSLVGRGEYDSHGKLSNNPSLQGSTTMHFGDKEAKVNNCYGGSPTIGDHRIAPEFEALVQAAENNQLAPPDQRDKAIPLIVNYNNLQNLDKKDGEGPRSRTIMLLNLKFPLSFRGTTFAKDSALYMMKQEKDVVWENPQQFGEVMLHQLQRSFDPKETGHGFYFHGSQKEWEPIFNAVIQKANEHFKDVKGEPRQLQGAYQEYVYSMLNAFLEMRSLQELIDQGIDRPTIMAISACKENIDRGGMENTKYMYTRLSSDVKNEKKRSLLTGVMHSRALSARDRVILKKRMPQVLDFMRTVTPEDFLREMQEFCKQQGYHTDAMRYEVFRPVSAVAA